MRNLKLIAMMLVLPLYAADNEIYVDQAGATLNLDLEQLGSGNIIGGLNSTAGSLTALDLDGATMTLDINQIGNANKFLGDIYGDSVTDFLSSMVIVMFLLYKETQQIRSVLITLIIMLMLLEALTHLP